VQGKVLDVATGTGTYGRHVASDERAVFGIDISFDMLRKGREYSIREGVCNIHFSRANAEALPFADHTFDGCLFCGALHLFLDPRSTLAEVGRTLKAGSPIWVTTLVSRDDGTFQPRRKDQDAGKGEMVRVFQKSELPEIFTGAGFDRVELQTQGSLASIIARKT
jgi:ubiquinone/menaquinone biosynthesis C-methylase UbiE